MPQIMLTLRFFSIFTYRTRIILLILHMSKLEAQKDEETIRIRKAKLGLEVLVQCSLY